MGKGRGVAGGGGGGGRMGVGCNVSLKWDRLVGLAVKASTSRAPDLGSNPAFVVDLFAGRVIPVT